MDKPDHLISLLEAAREEAVRLGAAAGTIAAQLDEALTEARALLVRNGRPDQGRRPEDLSSANDG